MTVSPFTKQLFIIQMLYFSLCQSIITYCLTAWGAAAPLLAALSVGGAASFPTVLLHQLKSDGSSILLDLDTASWIGSIQGLAGIPSTFLPTIMQWRGRKFAFIAACLVTIIGWIVAYTASSAAAILICESLHGFGTNSILAVSFLCISEMISPDYRQSYMQSYAVIQTSTMALNGILTRYLHWKTISIIMCIPMVVAVTIACAWPESPYWLALRGEYDKCAEVFTWLRGTDKHSKNELKLLIHTQKENSVTNKQNISVREVWNTVKRRDFYLPSFHMFVLQYLFYWSGNYVILIYSIELIEMTTRNENATFYAGLIMNAILSFGICASLILCRYFKKKVILLCCAVVIVITMFSASVITYLQWAGSYPKDSMLCLYCLIAYMIANGIGVVPIAYNIAIEIMPVKHRGLGGALIVVCSCILHSTSLKISPYLFRYIHLWGSFLFYTANTFLCSLFIWKYVPETKDRSLQELEQYYTFGKFSQEQIGNDGCGYEDVEETKEMEREMLVMDP